METTMQIHINKLTLAELQAVKRACNIIEKQGAETFLSDKQMQSIDARIQELKMCPDCELTKYIKKLKEKQ